MRSPINLRLTLLFILLNKVGNQLKRRLIALKIGVAPRIEHGVIVGKGIATQSDNNIRGDLIITYDVGLPTALTEEQKILIEKLQQTGL